MEGLAAQGIQMSVRPDSILAEACDEVFGSLVASRRRGATVTAAISSDSIGMEALSTMPPLETRLPPEWKIMPVAVQSSWQSQLTTCATFSAARMAQ